VIFIIITPEVMLILGRERATPAMGTKPLLLVMAPDTSSVNQFLAGEAERTKMLGRGSTEDGASTAVEDLSANVVS